MPLSYYQWAGQREIKKQACKPGSVPDKSGPYHLSGPDFTIGINQSTRSVCADRPEQLTSR